MPHYAICMSAECNECMGELYFYQLNNPVKQSYIDIITCGKHKISRLPKYILYGKNGKVIGGTQMTFEYPLDALTFEQKIHSNLYNFNIKQIYLLDLPNYEEFYNIQHISLENLKKLQPTLDILKAHIYIEMEEVFYRLRCKIPNRDYKHPDYIIDYNATLENGDILAYIYTPDESKIKNLPVELTVCDKYDQIIKVCYNPRHFGHASRSS